MSFKGNIYIIYKYEYWSIIGLTLDFNFIDTSWNALKVDMHIVFVGVHKLFEFLKFSWLY
jgi:hypothetical protein